MATEAHALKLDVIISFKGACHRIDSGDSWNAKGNVNCGHVAFNGRRPVILMFGIEMREQVHAGFSGIFASTLGTKFPGMAVIVDERFCDVLRLKIFPGRKSSFGLFWSRRMVRILLFLLILGFVL